MQWYSIVPALSNTCLKISSGLSNPESNPFVGTFVDGFPSVTVCVVKSLFVQITVSPTLILTGFGWYALSSSPAASVTIETFFILEITGFVFVKFAAVDVVFPSDMIVVDCLLNFAAALIQMLLENAKKHEIELLDIHMIIE
jgi:hypothetical protein